MIAKKTYISRLQEGRLGQLFENFPVVVVTGARQVGKSTLLEHLFPALSRIVFDPVVDVENARQDPDLFLANRKPPIILDEIQYVPELVPAIKRKLEKDRSSGQYLITGSQQWGIMKLLTESLAGRAVFLDLEGFSLGELAKAQKPWLQQCLEDPNSFQSVQHESLSLPFLLYEQLWRGFLPETRFLSKELIPDFQRAYQRTYIERDVRQMSDVSDLQLFGRFFCLCGALTAQEINYSHLGRELGLTPQTATRWLRLLQATFQWFELPAYSGNTIKRISGKPKGYLSDTGLACSSLAISSPEAIPNHPAWGHLFETAVVNEIRKQTRFMSTPPHLYHWRSHGGAEVDLLLEWNGQFYPVEIKAKSRISSSDTKGLRSFRETYSNLSISVSLIIAPTERILRLKDNIVVVPWDLK